MKQKVIETINRYNMIEKGDSIVIGLSGGADSVCLALVLNEIKNDYNIILKAVHINHMLRGEEADRDMLFCEKLCKKLDIPFKCYCYDVKALASKAKTGVEEFARKLRYDCFEKECGGGKVATAHNLDDVAETMIFNITRGSSVNGLCSIPAVRGNIIRPLINVSRNDIEDYLKQKSQDFVNDSTNFSDDYTRNKIRHNVIPALKEINPSFLQSVLRLRESAASQNDYIKQSAEKLKNLPVSELRNAHEAVLASYVYDFVKGKKGIYLDNFHINQCIDVIKNTGRCQLPQDYIFSVVNDEIKIEKPEKKDFADYEVPLSKKSITPYNTYYTKTVSYDEFKNNKNVYNLFLNNAIDYDRICHSLILRNRRAGDRIRLKNRRVNKQVKVIFNELKIPPDIRNKLAVIECNGEIVWVENVGVAEKYCPGSNTNTVLLISREVDYY